jgi:hypothetical protein
MSTELIVAWIAALFALLSALVSVYGQIRITQIQHKFEQEKTEKSKNEDAEKILSKYREPLVQAAFDLQSRMYNIIENGLINYAFTQGDRGEQEYVIENTLYVFGQYFGWTEVIRLDIQFLNLGEVESTRKLAQLQENISELFLTHVHGVEFRTYRGEQRAIGERMMTRIGENYSVIGYASFVEMNSHEFQRWFNQLRKDLDLLVKNPKTYPKRLFLLQHALLDLIDFLDPHYMRFSKEYRTRLQQL